MGCWEIKGKECCFFIFLFFPRNVCHREKNVTELHRREIPGKDWVRMLWAAEAKALLFLDCRARDEMYNCPKDNGKAQNENRSDVNYWCFLGDCVVVMSTILFILIAFWFCLVVLCSPLLQFAMLAGERNYMETCRFSEKPPYILFNCLEKLFCTNSNSWNKAKRVWVNLGFSSHEKQVLSSLPNFLKVQYCTSWTLCSCAFARMGGCQHSQGGMLFVVDQ